VICDVLSDFEHLDRQNLGRDENKISDMTSVATAQLKAELSRPLG
jgi:hypothetical protein